MARKTRGVDQTLEYIDEIANDRLPRAQTEMGAADDLLRRSYKDLHFAYDEEIEDTDVREKVRFAAAEIKQKRTTSAKYIVEIGTALRNVQELIPGKFTRWLREEFDYSITSAYEFMNIAQRFADDYTSILNFSPTILAVAAAPTLPEEGAQKIIEVATQRAEEGGKLTLKEAHQIAKEYRDMSDRRPKDQRAPKTVDAAPSYASQASYSVGVSDAGAALAPVVVEAPVAEKPQKVYGGVNIILPKRLWIKLLDALESFNLNPILNDKDSAVVISAIREAVGEVA